MKAINTKRTLIFLTALLLASPSVAYAADDLVVYPPVPGLAASEHCQVRVRSGAGAAGASPTLVSVI